MTQLYATGSSQFFPATMTFFVTTPIEPSLQVFMAGIAFGSIITFLIITCMALFASTAK
jgi:hypothetical protein